MHQSRLSEFSLMLFGRAQKQWHSLTYATRGKKSLKTCVIIYTARVDEWRRRARTRARTSVGSYRRVFAVIRRFGIFWQANLPRGFLRALAALRMTLLWEMAVRRRLTNDAQTSRDRPAYSVLSRAARHCFLHPRAIASVAKMARRCRYCCRCLVTPPPIGNRSIVMSVSVCVRVCVC